METRQNGSKTMETKAMEIGGDKKQQGTGATDKDQQRQKPIKTKDNGNKSLNVPLTGTRTMG
jgi:hypothetical protein